MDRKTLILIGTICSLVVLGSLLLFPIATWGEGERADSARAISHDAGPFLLLFAWFAAAFSGLVCWNKTHILGLSDKRHLAISFLAFKLTCFFFLALLIDGPGRESVSWGVGFWFAFIAALAGTMAVFLTFNPELAKRLAEVAKSDDAPASDDAGGDAVEMKEDG